MRYLFYRAHKYVSAALNDLERLIAKTDFRNERQLNTVDQEFKALAGMLKGHAEYEDVKLHALLKKKNSNVHKHIEEDHGHQDEQLHAIQELVNHISKAATDDEKVAAGYQLYLAYRKFVADNLIHLHEEETIILPELHRLYSDEELGQVDASTYAMMTPEQMVGMMKGLFPHMNATDRLFFLAGIKKAQPDKFKAAWEGIKSMIDSQELAELAHALQIGS